MKRTIGFGILSAATILGCGACALAQGPDAGRPAGGMPPGAPQEMRGEQLKKAGATDAQIQALTDLDFAQREKQIDLRAKAEKAQLALDRQMASTNADEKAAMAAVDALSQAQGELMKLEIGAQLKRKQLLGDELMKKLQSLRPQRPEGRTPGMGGQNTPGGMNARGPGGMGMGSGNAAPGGMNTQGRMPRGPMPDEGQRPPMPIPGGRE